MAELTPARITYLLGATEQVIRFHSVISEGHQASSEVTKFPVQSGFQISNHAIRHNRKVIIEAIISNTLISGVGTSSEEYQYSLTDNSKTVFSLLKDIVNNKTKTTVLTNLGLYTPVIFTSFKTKQMVGLVDSMKVTLVGEEIQESTALNGTSPKVLNFKEVPEPQSRIQDLIDAGVDIANGKPITEVIVDLGEDFAIGSKDELGVNSITTYINKGVDIVTGAYNYAVHSTDTGLFIDPSAIVSDLVGVGVSLIGKITTGAHDPVGCLVSGATEVLEDAATEYIDTAMGKLTKSAYGAFYGMTHMSGNDVGQALIGLSAGCVIRGVTGHDNKFPYSPGESLPSASTILDAAKRLGNELSSDSRRTSSGVVTTPTTLTKF